MSKRMFFTPNRAEWQFINTHKSVYNLEKPQDVIRAALERLMEEELTEELTLAYDRLARKIQKLNPDEADENLATETTALRSRLLQRLRRSGTVRQGVTATVNWFEQHGFVERVRRPADLPGVRFCQDERGESVAEKLVALQNVFHVQVAALKGCEKAMAVAFLRNVIDDVMVRIDKPDQ